MRSYDMLRKNSIRTMMMYPRERERERGDDHKLKTQCQDFTLLFLFSGRQLNKKS